MVASRTEPRLRVRSYLLQDLGRWSLAAEVKMSLGDVGENVVPHLFVAPDLCIEDYEEFVVLYSST
jgi:hypothetical protein